LCPLSRSWTLSTFRLHHPKTGSAAKIQKGGRYRRDTLDKQLAENEYIAGERYTIADIAIWPWYGGLAKGWLYGAAEYLSVQDYKHLQRWADLIGARPAVQRGRMVNRTSGEPSSQLRERHDTADFETKMQDKISGEG
jgi:GST-like protein